MSTTDETIPFSILATVPPASGITRSRKLRHMENRQLFCILPLKELLPAARDYLLTHSDADTAKLTATLKSFFKSTAADCFHDSPGLFKATHGQLFITVNRHASVLTWHRDPRVINPSPPGRVYSRYGMALLGPPTRVLKPSAAVDARLLKQPGYNSLTAADIKASEEHQIEHRQIYRFTTGQPDSPVHSTPVYAEDRIFLSVLYHQKF